jgi:uncharacterized coiled-coil protein SlyX
MGISVNPESFKHYAENKPVDEFHPGKASRNFHAEACARFLSRINELNLQIADLQVDIQSSRHSGYHVRHLQNRLRDTEEAKLWNEKILERMSG